MSDGLLTHRRVLIDWMSPQSLFVALKESYYRGSHRAPTNAGSPVTARPRRHAFASECSAAKTEDISMKVSDLKARLRLPIIAAPMFLVSGPELLIATCKSGVVGSLPTINARTAEDFESWLQRIARELDPTRMESGARAPAPYAINLVVQSAGSPRFIEDLKLIERHQPPIVITSVGQPGEVVKRVHDYGGIVFHDVASLRHATKAIEGGVDGLILLTAGAGGHTGVANPFAFVPQIRKNWDGAVLLAGAISDGRSVLAAEVLGADFAYMGTRFAATQESLASANYKTLLVSQQMADVITTDRISGMSATFLRGSIIQAGLDPDNLPPTAGFLKPTITPDIKAWRDVWSGGHGVGLIDDIPTVAQLLTRLEAEYRAASGALRLERFDNGGVCNAGSPAVTVRL